MVTVEFLGLPGSGKSTVASHVVDLVKGSIDLEGAVRLAVARGGHDALLRIAARRQSEEDEVQALAHGARSSLGMTVPTKSLEK